MDAVSEDVAGGPGLGLPGVNNRYACNSGQPVRTRR